MDFLKIAVTAGISVIVLFIIARVIGYRQVSQISMFDYVNGITIGSIAAELAISDWNDMQDPLVALIIYGLATLLISIATDKSTVLRRIIAGSPIILIERGKFYDKGFSKARLDINEFQIQCRNQGYFDPREIDAAIMEPNGNISILPKSQEKPLTPKDMNLVTQQDIMPSNIILDGKIMYKNMENIGINKDLLIKELKKQNIEITDVFLATCNYNQEFNFYKKNGIYKKDILS